jgi:hypothetical protein
MTRTPAQLPTCPDWCQLAAGDPGHGHNDNDEHAHERSIGTVTLRGNDGTEEVWVSVRRYTSPGGTDTKPPAVVITRVRPTGPIEVRITDAGGMRALAEAIVAATDFLESL